MGFSDYMNSFHSNLKRGFGQQVLYRPAEAGGEYTIRGIFDENFQLVQPGSEVGIQSTAPVLGIDLSDLPGITPDEGDTAVINWKTYRVIESRPDGKGWTQLVLSAK